MNGNHTRSCALPTDFELCSPLSVVILFDAFMQKSLKFSTLASIVWNEQPDKENWLVLKTYIDIDTLTKPIRQLHAYLLWTGLSDKILFLSHSKSENLLLTLECAKLKLMSLVYYYKKQKKEIKKEVKDSQWKYP